MCRISAVTTAIPSLDTLIPTECYLGWDVELTTDQPRAVIEEVFMFIIDDMTLEITALKAPDDQTITKPDHPVAVAEPEAPATDAKTWRPDASVRVPAPRLDELMDRVGELVIAQSRLKQIAKASTDMNPRSVAEDTALLTQR